MNINIIRGLFESSRPMNVVIAVLASLVGLQFINDEMSIRVLPILIIVGLLTIVANTTNDIVDNSIDKINRDERPLPSGKILVHHLIVYSIVLLLIVLYIVVVSAIHFNGKLFSIFIILPTIFLYNLYLKKLPIIGNIIVATVLGSVFLFVELATRGNIQYTIEPFMLASLLSFPRELIKDIEDITGDKTHDLRTFPIEFGIGKSVFIFKISLVVLIVYSVYLFFFNNSFGARYFATLILLIHVPLLYCFFITTFKKNIDYSLISTILKVCTCFGLFVILCGRVT